MQKFYWLPYLISRSLSRLAKQQSNDLEIVFVLPDNGKGWILDGICREIAARYPGKYEFSYGTSNLPRAHKYFFSHYWLMKSALLKKPYAWNSDKYVWFTHPKKELGISDKELAYLLNLANCTICTCSVFEKLLVDIGVYKSRLCTIIGGADPDIFHYHERSGNVVGFSSAFYERKCPDKILGIVESMPHAKFILLGRGWDKWGNFRKLNSLQNFEYVDAEYDKYPDYYRQMDVFVSTSKLEGGPIPVIEAMMCNVMPVVSDTGFARDVINDGQNGYIFPVEADVDIICMLIDKALNNRLTNVRETVEDLSWETFSGKVISILNKTELGREARVGLAIKRN